MLTRNLGNVRIDLQLEGVFTQNWAFENSPEMYFGGDASGGPYSADPRKRKVAFAVVALIKHSGMGVWQVVGSMTANLPGQVQTVPLGEAFSLVCCLKATLNSFCFVTDARYVYNRARKLSRNSVATFTHPDVWTEIAELSRERPGRLKMHSIKSHLAREQWLANNGEDEIWQWLANKEADKLCSNRAATLAGKRASIMQDWVDARVTKVLQRHIQVVIALQEDANARFLERKKARKQCREARVTKKTLFDRALKPGPGPLDSDNHVWKRSRQGIEAPQAQDTAPPS